MKALITQREEINQYGDSVDSLESAYIRYFESLGVTLMPVSNFMSEPSVACQNKFDLLILTGGGSLPSKAYNPPFNSTESINRDVTESTLLGYAIKKDIPVVAICRGMQFVNCYFGGTIAKLVNLPEPREIAKAHIVSSDDVELSVNNYHNDGIFLPQLAPELQPLFIDKTNNIVEAFTHKEHRILGFQWHPERKIEDSFSREYTDKLIFNFIK